MKKTNKSVLREQRDIVDFWCLFERVFGDGHWDFWKIQKVNVDKYITGPPLNNLLSYEIVYFLKNTLQMPNSGKAMFVCIPLDGRHRTAYSF